MSYSVYKHTFPNGKIYIGITSLNPEDRWKNGHGYLSRKNNDKYYQPLIANAIIEYGWENIISEILFQGLTKGEAQHKEAKLIAKYKSNQEEYGYNIKEYSSKMIRCVETGVVYSTIAQAAKENKCSGIFACLKGGRKTSGGYHWEYVE